ncbi:hypothetical protein JDV09_15895 [Mycobacterium sp. Y57]|uniref:hypothetical protein n=1 Tax=Mycolicibacterium xanthum TaxID=2796469 RepID=UPI001C84A5D0|nr:hypothetical protein [Mycolicibacterium xanthum]MBX7433581.1 hypothetical protein [Mycolicibacterium xanthum]
MDSDQAINIALTVITPILTAGIGIGALVIGDWRERRTRAGRRKLAFEDASRQIEFATEWFKASKDIAPDQEQQSAVRAHEWLEEAAELVAESKPPSREAQKRSVTVRRLLLAYPMHRRSARVLRGFYYFFLGVMILQVSGALGSAFGRTDTLGVPNYISGGLVYADLIGIAMYTLVAMGFRFLSLRAETSPESAPHDPMTVRRALLLHRLTGIRAKFARLVFHLWVMLIVLIAVIMVVTSIDDPRVLPANVIVLIAWCGWAVGLRYWAVSLDQRATSSADHA